jgi:hypothetical protein
MPIIYKILSSLIVDFKTAVARAACQAAREIFQTVRCPAKLVSKCQLRNPSTYMKKVLKT